MTFCWLKAFWRACRFAAPIPVPSFGSAFLGSTPDVMDCERPSVFTSTRGCSKFEVGSAKGVVASWKSGKARILRQLMRSSGDTVSSPGRRLKSQLELELVIKENIMDKLNRRRIPPIASDQSVLE